MTQKSAMALIVARPDRLSDGWRALLAATPWIARVRQADDASSALEAVEALDPDLVLLDADAFGEAAWALLDRIKAETHNCCCIALICSDRHRLQALARGADAVLVKGFSAEELSITLKRLLSPQKDTERPE